MDSQADNASKQGIPQAAGEQEPEGPQESLRDTGALRLCPLPFQDTEILESIWDRPFRTGGGRVLLWEEAFGAMREVPMGSLSSSSFPSNKGGRVMGTESGTSSGIGPGV